MEAIGIDISYTAIIGLIKICIDIKIAKEELAEDIIRIQDRLEYLLIIIPEWNESISIDNSNIDTRTELKQSVLRRNVYAALRKLRFSLQAAACPNVKWTTKLNRMFQPQDVAKTLIKDEDSLIKAMHDIQFLQIMNISSTLIPSTTTDITSNNNNSSTRHGVSQDVTRVLNSCYDQDEYSSRLMITTTSIISTTNESEDRNNDNDMYYLIKFDNVHFEYEKRIGAGTFGEVFEGLYYNKSNKEQVAIKEINIYQGYPIISKMPYDVFVLQCNRIRGETIWMKHTCIHPNIVTVYGCCIPDKPSKRPLIVMELMDMSLHAMIHDTSFMKNQQLSYYQRLHFLQGIGSAIEHLHIQGIVHQDIKLSNILVDCTLNIAKLSDFGLAENKQKYGNEWDKLRSTTVTPALVQQHRTAYTTASEKYGTSTVNYNNTSNAERMKNGTYAYMAPEKLLNKVITASRSSDIYSFGVCIWECVSCQYVPYPKPIIELQEWDNVQQQSGHTKDIVLLEFPIKGCINAKQQQEEYGKILLPTTINEKKIFSILERSSLCCLLWDYKDRPNATQLTKLLSGMNVASVLSDVEVVLLSIWDKEDQQQQQQHDNDDDSNINNNTKRKTISNNIINDLVHYCNDIQLEYNDNENCVREFVQQPQRPQQPQLSKCNPMESDNGGGARHVYNNNSNNNSHHNSISNNKILSNKQIGISPNDETTASSSTFVGPSSQNEPISTNDSYPTTFPSHGNSATTSQMQNSYSSSSRRPLLIVGVVVVVLIVAVLVGVFLLREKDNTNNNQTTTPAALSPPAARPIPAVPTAPVTPTVQGALPTIPGISGVCFTSGDELRASVRDYVTGDTMVRSIYGSSISDWCVSPVQDFNDIFHDENGVIFQSFNEDISRWDTSNATSMYRMFKYANNFNQYLGEWDVQNVIEMSQMFWDCFAFNGDLSSWDVGNVQYAAYMFHGARLFNSDLIQWNVTNMQLMTGLFIGASVFNQDISLWNVISATDISSMFGHAQSFRQSLCPWRTILPLNTIVNEYIFENTSCPTTFAIPSISGTQWIGPFCFSC